MEAAWRDITGSHLLRIEHVHAECMWLRGTSAVAAARHDLARLAIADTCARHLDKIGSPYACVTGRQLRAAILLRRGVRDAAIECLRGTIDAAERHEMAAHAATARLRLGLILGGDEGRALIVVAEQWMRDQGVVNPRAFAALLSPVEDGE